MWGGAVSGLGSQVWVPGDVGGAQGPCAGLSGDGMRLRADSLRVREDEDNGPVLQSARDALKLIQNKFLPAVCTWLQVGESPSRPRAIVGRVWVCVGRLASLVTRPLRGSSSPVQGLRVGT